MDFWGVIAGGKPEWVFRMWSQVRGPSGESIFWFGAILSSCFEIGARMVGGILPFCFRHRGMMGGTGLCCCRPLKRALLSFASLPSAYALGYCLPPLRGWSVKAGSGGFTRRYPNVMGILAFVLGARLRDFRVRPVPRLSGSTIVVQSIWRHHARRGRPPLHGRC